MPFLGKSSVRAATDLQIDGSTINNATIANCTIQDGSITHSTIIEKKVAATSGTTPTFDIDTGASFEHSATASFTANFTNVPASHTTSWTLKVVNDGTARTVTWAVAGNTSAMEWAAGQVPPPSTGTDLYSFVSIAGTVYGSLAMRDIS